MISLLIAGLIAATPVTGQDNNLLKSFCLTAFKAAMSQAGEIPPPGKGEETCSCFLDEVAGGAGIDTARDTCKQRDAAAYKPET
jgi:hypothetical protein